MMKINKMLKQKCIGIMLALSNFSITFAAPDYAGAKAKVSTWGDGVMGIVMEVVKYAGYAGIAIIGICMYINNDEQAGKTLKKSLAVVAFVTFLLTIRTYII